MLLYAFLGGLAVLAVAAGVGLQKYYIGGVRRAVGWIVGRSLPVFVKLGITPNRMTSAGVSLCVAASGLVLLAHYDRVFYWVAAAVFFVGAMLDVFDGTLARATGASTPFGGFADSVTDRLGEGMMLSCIGLLFMWQHHRFAAFIIGPTILGSCLVSYARAKAEQLDIECRDGIGGRAERCFLIIAGLVLAPKGALPWAIYVLAGIAWVTVGHRMLVVRQKLEGRATLLKAGERFVGLLAGILTLSIVMMYFGIDSPW